MRSSTAGSSFLDIAAVIEATLEAPPGAGVHSFEQLGAGRHAGPRDGCREGRGANRGRLSEPRRDVAGRA